MFQSSSDIRSALEGSIRLASSGFPEKPRNEYGILCYLSDTENNTFDLWETDDLTNDILPGFIGIRIKTGRYMLHATKVEFQRSKHIFTQLVSLI